MTQNERWTTSDGRPTVHSGSGCFVLSTIMLRLLLWLALPCPSVRAVSSTASADHPPELRDYSDAHKAYYARRDSDQPWCETVMGVFLCVSVCVPVCLVCSNSPILWELCFRFYPYRSVAVSPVECGAKPIPKGSIDRVNQFWITGYSWLTSGQIVILLTQYFPFANAFGPLQPAVAVIAINSAAVIGPPSQRASEVIGKSNAP